MAETKVPEPSVAGSGFFLSGSTPRLPQLKRISDEARLLAIRRAAAGIPSTEAATDASPRLPPGAIGFSLSGGGVRSATFCLGVFQALAASKSIARIDYLSAKLGDGAASDKVTRAGLAIRYALDVYGIYALFLAVPPLIWWVHQ